MLTDDERSAFLQSIARVRQRAAQALRQAQGADGADGAGDAQGDARADAAVWQTAAAFELLHSAFVVHDDLIDRDLERRGEPNVAGRFRVRAGHYGAAADDAALVGDAAAVLAGDLLADL